MYQSVGSQNLDPQDRLAVNPYGEPYIAVGGEPSDYEEREVRSLPSTHHPSDMQSFGFAQPGRPHHSGRSKDGSPHATDEVFNASSHLAGSLLSILGLAMLVSKSSVEGKVWHIVAFSIFGGMSFALFFCSFLHHGLHSPRFDHIFRMADYMCIYLMIAGTFTPLCLVFMHKFWRGWTYFGAAWMIATMGITSHAIWGEKLPKWLSNTLYGVMGFMGFLIAPSLYGYMGLGGVAALALGGVAYIVGLVVFVVEEPNPIPGRFGFHEVWHSLVLIGAALHWFVMYHYVQPYPAE